MRVKSALNTPIETGYMGYVDWAEGHVHNPGISHNTTQTIQNFIMYLVKYLNASPSKHTGIRSLVDDYCAIFVVLEP